MSSLFTEIVSELRRNNPDASPEELSESLIEVMEREILPNAIKNMRLPSPPSSLQVRLEELRLRRVKKKFRKPSSLKKRERLIREFEYVKYQFNGGRADSPFFAPEISLTDLDNPKRLLFELSNNPSVQEVFLKKDGISIESIPKERTVIPYTKLVKEKEKVKFPKFVITQEIQNKIVSDSLFRDIFRAIEITVKGFVTTYPSKIDLTASLHTDLEIPEWKKVVLGINAPGVDFDQKMTLWDIIDAKIREAIAEIMQHAGPSERRSIEDINRNLFTRMELI